MLIVRAYSVLDMLVTEVSCVHPGDPLGSHLVWRESSVSMPDSREGVLRRLSQTLELAAHVEASGEGLGPSCEVA